MATHSEILKEYDDNKAFFEKLCKKAKEILEEELKSKKIPYLDIYNRVKERDSLKSKLDKKSYNGLGDITDIVGIRIITFTELELDIVNNVVEDIFKIYPEHCIDKSKTLGTNKVGYKSIHYICDLGENRKNISEYRHISEIKFEIQTRTILQHAWAEVEHDKNYKFAGELPKELKRRFYLLAGTLELLDREFKSLSSDIDKYAEEQKTKIDNNELDISIDTISINEYLKSVLPADAHIDFNTNEKVIGEILRFGITKVSDFDTIYKKDFLPNLEKIDKNFYFNYITSMGIIRHILMLSDIEKYFSIFNNSWNGVDNNIIIDILKAKYSEEKFLELFKQYKIEQYDY